MTNDKEYRLSASINDGIIEIILSGTVTRTNVSRLQKEIDSLVAELKMVQQEMDKYLKELLK